MAGLPQPTSEALVPSLTTPAQLDAVSFADIALTPSASGPEYVYSEYALRSQLQQYMIRSHRYKYIHNHGGEFDELYDLEKDPGEYHNRIRDGGYTRTASELRDNLYSWYDPASNPYR